jgi:cytochrome c55X
MDCRTVCRYSYRLIPALLGTLLITPAIGELADGPSMARSPRLDPIGESADATSIGSGILLRPTSSIPGVVARGPADAQDAQMPRRPGTAESGLDPIGELENGPSMARSPRLDPIVESAAHQAQAGVRPASPAAQIGYPDSQRQQQLMYLLAQDCGSCHGMSLQGGLGPALTREALAGKPPVMLRDVILHGRPGTPMPPWKTFLTERDAEWLVQVLVNGLGP